MPKLRKIEASCAVLALRFVSGLEEAVVIETCLDNGFEWGEGMTDEEWSEAAKELGVEKRAIPLETCSLREFIKKYPVGTFLVGTRNHLMVVHNGGVISRPGTQTPDFRRRIRQAWKVSKN